jgi:hypothetical protein
VPATQEGADLFSLWHQGHGITLKTGWHGFCIAPSFAPKAISSIWRASLQSRPVVFVWPRS